MDALSNLELLSVGIAIAGTALLGVVLLLNNPRSVTNRSFFYFSCITVCWSIVNYAYYQLPAGQLALWLLRLVIFFATWHAFTFCNFSLNFPQDSVKHSRWYRFAFIPATILVSLLTLTPFVFKSINAVSSSGAIGGVQNGSLIPVFGTFVFCEIAFGIFILVRKTIKTTKELRHPYELLVGGMIATFILLVTFNLIIPAVFNNPTYIPLGALFLLPFVIASAVAILRYRLFSIRVAAVSVLSFFLSSAVFIDIIYSRTLSSAIFTTSEFILVLIFSFWLIQGVLREVRQREHIEKLAQDLEKANNQQVILIHFITHQLKGFVTKSRNIFSVLLEGDFGVLPETMKPMVEEGFRSDTKGAQTIQEILNAANIKSGKVTYAMATFDLKALIEEIVHDLKPGAEAKRLELKLSIGDEPLGFSGDREQLLNAFKNLIDNSIKYTPSGSVEVILRKDSGKIHFEIKDTGVGITSEDMKNLFTEGGHGIESQKINVESTGFGLYIVKNIIEGHGGKVWAQSEGAGKGSQFIAELPISA